MGVGELTLKTPTTNCAIIITRVSVPTCAEVGLGWVWLGWVWFGLLILLILLIY